MSLSKFLHNPEYIGKVAEYDFIKGREFFGNLALGYLSEHNDYYSLIKSNLMYFGLPYNNDAVENSVKHIGYHYHEKFLSFIKEPEFYPEFHKRIIKSDDVIDEILQNQKEKQPTVILSTHFGAMALIVGVLSSCKMEISSILKFPSEEFKNLIISKGLNIIETLGYGCTKFFEVDKQPMAKIANGLGAGETFFSVLDEHTPLNVNVNFLGKTITGGVGIDQIIHFTGKDGIKVYFTIMVRVGNNYKLDLHRIDLNSDNYIQEMFNIYEKYVLENYEQWFFLQEIHENMPEHS